MEELPSDKIHKTFRDDLLSNIFEVKNDCLGAGIDVTNPFSSAAHATEIDVTNPFSSDRFATRSLIQTMADEASQTIATSGLGTSAITLGVDPNLFSSDRFATRSLIQTMIGQSIASPNSTFAELATSGLGMSAITLGVDPNLFSSDRFATTGSLIQTMADEASQIIVSNHLGYPDSASIDLTPLIPTEFEPQNNIHEEQDKKIEKLENKFFKFVTQVRKLSKKFDDLRNDTHDSIEYMARQFDILANDVDVLTALVEDDEEE